MILVLEHRLPEPVVVETLSSLPLGGLTRAYYDLQLVSSTSLANRSNLGDRSIRLHSAGLDTASQEDAEVPMVDLRGKLKSLSCGVQVVAVHSNER